jgi:hypothetical protein
VIFRYQMSEFDAPEAARGVCWNVPAFAIPCSEHQRTIIDRDDSYPDFRA